MSQNQTPNAGTTALAFNSFTFDVIVRDGKQWLRGYQVGSALEYTQPDAAVSKLYERNKDEFTNSMTTVLKLDTAGGAQDVRVFSLRGAHLLGMFARTDVAKAFRRWVLDVLDREVEQQIAAAVAAMQPSTIDYTRINPAQAQALSELVIAETKRTGKHYKTVWGSFNRHFQVNSYHELPAARFDEACQWLGGKRVAAKTAPATSYDVPAVDFDFKAELTTGLTDPKDMPPEAEFAINRHAWALAGQTVPVFIQFLQRYTSHKLNRADQHNLPRVEALLAPLTVDHCLMHRYFGGLNAMRSVMVASHQMIADSLCRIDERMGTIMA